MIDLNSFDRVATEMGEAINSLPQKYREEIGNAVARCFKVMFERHRVHTSYEDGPITNPGIYALIVQDAICPVMLLTVTESMLERGKILDLPKKYHYIYLSIEADPNKLLAYCAKNMKDKRHL